MSLTLYQIFKLQMEHQLTKLRFCSHRHYKGQGPQDILNFQTLNVCQLCFIDGLCQMPF